MPHYLIEGTASAAAQAALIKAPQDRAEALRALCDRIGCKSSGYYFEVGRNRHFAILESPVPLSAEMINALLWMTEASGAVTSARICELLTSGEHVRALELAPTLGYRSPQG